MGDSLGIRVGLTVSAAVVLALFLQPHFGSAKRTSPRPGLLHASRLVIEIPRLEACDLPDNAIEYMNVTVGMVSKVDFGISADFRVKRPATGESAIIIRLVKCRDIVSANTCELYQTWRFDKNPCKTFMDPNALWRSYVDLVKPKFECPTKPAFYRMRNVTIGAGILQAVPLPWEGNVWLIRVGIMETKTKFHHCTDMEMRAHRVRD